MIVTKERFSFAVELTKGDMVQMEDMIYNCLDFCILHDLKPHFFLTAEQEDDALWHVLELLRQEDAGFSLLTEPERSQFAAACLKPDAVQIAFDGRICYGGHEIGNILEDRLADLWVMAGLE